MEEQEKQTQRKEGFARELTGLFLFFWAIFLVLSLVSFDRNDPTLNQVSSTALIHNKAGLFGAYVAGFLNEWFGLCSFLWPLFFVSLGLSCISKRFALHWRRWLGIFLLVLFLLETSVAWDITCGDFSPGGISGHGLYGCTSLYLHPLGASLLWLFVFMVGIQLILGISWFESASKLSHLVRGALQSREEKKLATPSSALLAPETSLDGKSFSGIFSRGLSLIRTRLGQKAVVNATEGQTAPENTKKESGENSQEESLFLPPENLFKGSSDEEDVLGLSARGKKTEEDEKAEEKKTEEKEKLQAEVQEKPEEKTPEEDTDKKESEVKEKDSSEEEIKKGRLTPLNSLRNLLKRAPVEKKEEKPTVRKAVHTGSGRYPLPQLSLLTPPSPSSSREKENHKEKAQILMQTLDDFSIAAELVTVTPGPVVTLFEVRPASGVKVSKFTGISEDLARVLKKPSVRVITPVPGKDTVGIEIPNSVRDIVNFQELAASDLFRREQGPMTMILGKDTAGKPVFADLTRMPHMLIAGATGKGKSVCLNSIIASFLLRAQPSELKLLLIDPKRVEMSVYADEPHLIHPVVNEPSEAKNALEWATHEMDNRFKAMSRLNVKNIAAFNKRLASFGKNKPDELKDLEHLPYIAIVIDELADLMLMSDRKDVENCIVRLAQLARACGIHLILATQRPSVNIVTGIIKANFPCRISFQVASNADSKTILDAAGAEKLLGNGDMLYKPVDTTIRRLHGAFLPDKDTIALVEYWKSLATPSYKVDFAEWAQEGGAWGGHINEQSEDDLFEQVLDFVTREGSASISRIQRRFKIGFNRSARLVEALEARGYLEAGNGSRPRKFIKPGMH